METSTPINVQISLIYEDTYFKTAQNVEYSGTFVSIQNISTKIELGTDKSIWKTLRNFFFAGKSIFFKKN